MPFNVWCDGCGELIGKGVRFNAEKQQVGTYHSTKVWAFTMRHHCGCKIVVRTDPKACDFMLDAGAKRKVRMRVLMACVLVICATSFMHESDAMLLPDSALRMFLKGNACIA